MKKILALFASLLFCANSFAVNYALPPVRGLIFINEASSPSGVAPVIWFSVDALADFSTFIGYAAGYGATPAPYTNFQATCVGSHTCGSLGVGMTGLGNTTYGWGGLANITSGSSNTTSGAAAGVNVTTGSNNLFLGAGAGSTNPTTGSNNILIGPVQTLAAGTSNEINIGGILFYNNTSLAAPTVSACGTSPAIDAHANAKSGTVTVGSGAVASCTITFASAYTTFDHCRVTPHSTIAVFAYSYTLAAITLTATSLTSDVVDYDCDGV